MNEFEFAGYTWKPNKKETGYFCFVEKDVIHILTDKYNSNMWIYGIGYEGNDSVNWESGFSSIEDAILEALEELGIDTGGIEVKDTIVSEITTSPPKNTKSPDVSGISKKDVQEIKDLIIEMDVRFQTAIMELREELTERMS